MAFRDHKEIIFTHIREISIDKIKIREVNNKRFYKWLSKIRKLERNILKKYFLEII